MMDIWLEANILVAGGNASGVQMRALKLPGRQYLVLEAYF